MIMKNIGICILLLVVLSAFNSVRADPLPAFPGAEGFGMYSLGGRGGTIYEVTDLNDYSSSPPAGSLRAAVEASGPRIVVFRVSGTIALVKTLKISNPYITIAGQTAPGDGICLKDYNFRIEANDVIIRYMRFRLGDNITGNEWDTVTIYKGQNIILDHLSASWSVDEVLSTDCETGHYAGNLTVQWCMITESLNCSIHPKGCHGYGSLIRGGNNNKYSFHHNLYAHNNGRNPRPGNYNNYTTDPCGLIFDFRNNVVYNYGGSKAGNNEDTTSVTRMNFIGNYYKRGTDSTGNYAFSEKCKYDRAYFSSNWMNTGYPADPWSLVNFYFGEPNITAYKLSSPVPVEPVTTDNAVTAYSLVLADAGASFPVRDSVDERIVNDVINGTGHIIDDEDEVGGWPMLNSLPAPTDSDHDGMPDLWETSHGLNPNDANDRNGHNLDPDYTNLEVYLDWLVSSVRTDIVYDGIVNFSDFARFAEHWNSSVGSPLYDERYDFNRNDTISMDDLFYIAQDWLTSGQEY
jgi:hypothetical protein